MKHTIRQHGQLTRIDCELGSDVYDKNGREIIEGDKVKTMTPDGEHEIGTVIFDTGTFMWVSDRWETELDSGGLYEPEVVGHVND